MEPGCGRLAATAADAAEPGLHRVGVEPAEVGQEAVGRELLIDPPVVVRLDQRGNRALQVDHVAGEECLHLAGDRVDRVARATLVAERLGERRGDPLDRVGTELQCLHEPAVGAVELVGMIRIPRALDELLRVGSLSVDLGLHVERIGVARAGEQVEEALRDVVGAPHDRARTSDA